jgi:hypothetical protein
VIVVLAVRTCTVPNKNLLTDGAEFAVTVAGVVQDLPAGRSAFASVSLTDPNAGIVNTSM